MASIKIKEYVRISIVLGHQEEVKAFRDYLSAFFVFQSKNKDITLKNLLNIVYKIPKRSILPDKNRNIQLNCPSMLKIYLQRAS